MVVVLASHWWLLTGSASNATQQRWHSRLYPTDAGIRFSDPGEIQGWIDLCTTVKVSSPCPRLHITVTFAINRAAEPSAVRFEPYNTMQYKSFITRAWSADGRIWGANFGPLTLQLGSLTRCLHFTAGCTTGWVNYANEPSQAALEWSSQDTCDVIRLTRSKAAVWTVDDVARLMEIFWKALFIDLFLPSAAYDPGGWQKMRLITKLYSTLFISLFYEYSKRFL